MLTECSPLLSVPVRQEWCRSIACPIKLHQHQSQMMWIFNSPASRKNAARVQVIHAESGNRAWYTVCAADSNPSRVVEVVLGNIRRGAVRQGKSASHNEKFRVGLDK